MDSDHSEIESEELFQNFSMFDVGMAEEQPATNNSILEQLVSPKSSLRKIKIYEPYEKWLRKQNFATRAILRPKLRKNRQIVPYQPLSLQEFIANEILK